MAGHAVKHDYHLVDPSPWPFVGSVGAFLLAVGAVGNMTGLVGPDHPLRSEEHTSELQSHHDLVCRLLLGAHV